MCFLFLQSLALAHVDVADGKVFFSPWSETDFRTGENPWWSWAHTSFPLIISKYTICRRIYLHSNLGLDSDDVHWDKLFIEWQILLKNCSLISLFSSHDLNWKHGFKFLSFGKVFHWHFVCRKNFKRNLVADFPKEINYCPPFFYGQKT